VTGEIFFRSEDATSAETRCTERLCSPFFVRQHFAQCRLCSFRCPKWQFAFNTLGLAHCKQNMVHLRSGHEPHPGAANAAAATKSTRQVHVKVPGTSANMGPGFDCFGLALHIHNELIVTRASKFRCVCTAQPLGLPHMVLQNTLELVPPAASTSTVTPMACRSLRGTSSSRRSCADWRPAGPPRSFCSWTSLPFRART
jgi:hypothetical protein